MCFHACRGDYSQRLCVPFVGAGHKYGTSVMVGMYATASILYLPRHFPSLLKLALINTASLGQRLCPVTHPADVDTEVVLMRCLEWIQNSQCDITGMMDK